MHEDWQQGTVDRAADLATELQNLVGTMDELIVDHLQTAVEQGVDGRPKLDRDLQTARRALEKAIRLLEQ